MGMSVLVRLVKILARVLGDAGESGPRRLGQFVAFGLLPLCVVACLNGSNTEQRNIDSVSERGPALLQSLTDSDHFSFMASGDMHLNSLDATRLRAILQDGTDRGSEFFIILGDIIDRGAWENYDVLVSTLAEMGWSGRFFPILGNHDIVGDSWTHYRQLFGANYYTFDVGNARFIALDTADGTIGKTQWAWLENQLDLARPTHTFVLTHYMPIVPAISTYLKMSDHEESARLMSLVIKKGVRAVLGGHYHSYLRQNIGGTEFIVAGLASGRPMEPITNRGYVEVRVNGTDVEYEPRLLY